MLRLFQLVGKTVCLWIATSVSISLLAYSTSILDRFTNLSVLIEIQGDVAVQRLYIIDLYRYPIFAYPPHHPDI